MQIIPTILCGGAGSRLWPLSREAFPKQFLPLVGDETMLQATLRRMADFSGVTVESPIIICNEEHRFLVAEQVRDACAGKATILLEPFGRNTAPALTIAALKALDAAHAGRDPVLLVMAADHVIANRQAFHEAVRAGLGPVQTTAIATFGIVPHRPETGYGYIHADRDNPGGNHCYPVIRFVEKPDRQTAETYCASGDYYWNSGMFLVKASTWIMAMEQFQPLMLSACRSAYDDGAEDADFVRLHRDSFAACPSDSIDYAVMEKLASPEAHALYGVMVPLDAGWTDVGSWDVLRDIGAHTGDGNCINGDVIAVNTRQSLIQATSRLVACVGLEECAVIETADAVLVATLDEIQNVKDIVSILKEQGRDEAQVHRTVYRPWGSYESVSQKEGCQVKHIIVNPAARLSLQLHHQRSEHWIIIRGQGLVTLDNETFSLGEGETIFIPRGMKHRLENTGAIPLEIIEVQRGSYLGEDDIIRFDDSYGRPTERDSERTAS